MPERGRPPRTPARTPADSRGRTTRHPAPALLHDPRRHRVGRVVMVGALVVAAAQLVRVQGVDAGELSAQSDAQRTSTVALAATRGAITDRHGTELAYTMEARALTFQPRVVQANLDSVYAQDPSAGSTAERLGEIADGINQVLGSAAPRQDVLDQLTADKGFVYLARFVDPADATAIQTRFPEVGAERQGVREYPGGALAANLVGATGYEGEGLLGLEASLDARLAGQDGRRVVERGEDGTVIPGSLSEEQPALDGADVALTIDADLQWYVQQATQQAKDLSGADNASVVVLDSATGEVLAMANDGTFDPSAELASAPPEALGNPSVSTPFEPGSVNKIVTAAAAIEDDLTTPDEVLSVPGSIDVADVTVRDAWSHGTLAMTTTGVFGKSSNVGTLQLAQRVGEQRYADLLADFGLGARTEVGLPGESAGSVPDISQWSGSTFANLPIGQGLSMTLLQMTGMYQAIANDGLRIPPRIVDATTAADGTRTETATPEGVQVVSPETARTVRDMFRSVVQDGEGQNRGTGVAAGIEGYQVSGKTGTAQQVDPACGCYSNSAYNITFAGIAPADDPRYVIGIMLDAPERAVDGGGGASAAPLFHDIAAWLLQRDDVPLSATPAPEQVLVR